MKRCSVCQAEKSLSDFQVRKASVDGFTAACKGCLQKRDAARYPKEAKKRAEWIKRYVKTVGGKRASNEAKARWREANKLKRSVHHILNNAIRDGKVNKPKSCSNCGKKGRIEGHHEDYTKPIDVIWLCHKCHYWRHRES